MQDTHEMMNRKEMVEAICVERDGLRTEIIEYQTNMYRCVFVVVTAVLSVGSVNFGPSFPISAETRLALILILPQLSMILVYFIAFLLSGQCITAGYIAALEEKINDLAGQDISLWESSVTLETFVGWKSSYFWGQLTIGVVLVSGLLMALVLSAQTVNQIVYTAIVAGELLIGVILFVAGYNAKENAKAVAMLRLFPPDGIRPSRVDQGQSSDKAV